MPAVTIAAADRPRSARPRYSIAPASTVPPCSPSTPDMARSRVVLPAPLLPSTATTPPSGTSSETSSRARTGPYRTRRPCTVSIAPPADRMEVQPAPPDGIRLAADGGPRSGVSRWIRAFRTRGGASGCRSGSCPHYQLVKSCRPTPVAGWRGVAHPCESRPRPRTRYQLMRWKSSAADRRVTYVNAEAWSVAHW
jgi:hypothetical protein